MKQLLFFLWVCVAVAGAWAQAAAGRGTVPAQAAIELRRAELRAALKAPQEREVQGRVLVSESSPLPRYWSAQERENLRQQLRQQHRD